MENTNARPDPPVMIKDDLLRIFIGNMTGMSERTTGNGMRIGDHNIAKYFQWMLECSVEPALKKIAEFLGIYSENFPKNTFTIHLGEQLMFLSAEHCNSFVYPPFKHEELAQYAMFEWLSATLVKNRSVNALEYVYIKQDRDRSRRDLVVLSNTFPIFNMSRHVN